MYRQDDDDACRHLQNGWGDMIKRFFLPAANQITVRPNQLSVDSLIEQELNQ